MLVEMYVCMYACICTYEDVFMEGRMYVLCRDVHMYSTYEDIPMYQRRISCALFHHASPFILESGPLTKPGSWPFWP